MRRALGVNHSTVFRRLNALEAALGVRLFDRLPGGYAPTAAGEGMRACAERVEHEVQDLELRITGGDVRLSGTLRVTTTDTLAHGLLMPHLAAFCAAYPGIELELITEQRAVQPVEARGRRRAAPGPPAGRGMVATGSARSRSRSTALRPISRPAARRARSASSAATR